MSGASGRVYLDHAATTAMVEPAKQAWLAQAGQIGNASSLHTSGRDARRAVEEARESIAADLRTRPSAVVFTSGGTESDNLAVKGLYWSRPESRILASAVEHHAVLDPVEWLESHEGASVQWLGVDDRGRVDPAEIATALAAGGVALCTVMWANNEVGTVQPVEEISRICRDNGVPFHTDAVQALGHLELDLGALDASAVTITSHKIGGPSGVGALILDPALQPTPILHGGGQEREVRSGTLDAAGIVGFAAAVRFAVEGQRMRAEKLQELRDYLIARVTAEVPSAILNGADVHDRLPGNAHFSFPGCEGDLLLMLLDAAGIDCSTGSACTAGIPEPSHVLLAMGVDPSLSRSSLRFSLAESTTRADIDALVAALPAAVDRAARAGSLADRER